MTGDVAFITLMGIVALALLRWGDPGHGGRMMNMQPIDDATPDIWQTPFYLRYNVPIPSDQIPILPTGSPYTFGLGVPARALNTPRTIAY